MKMLIGALVSGGVADILEKAGLSGIWPGVIEDAARILMVIIGFFIVKLIIKIILKYIKKWLGKKQVKNPFHGFILSIFKAIMWIMAVFLFLQLLKVPLSPVIAAVGTLGLGIGLALKDHMANIAGGIMIAVNKLFVIGDYVKCSDTEGVVERVELFFTRLKTFDNKVIFIPNATFTGNPVYNYTKENMRRVDVSIGVSYSANVDEVKNVLLQLIASNELIMHEPEAFIGITNYGDSSINFMVRAWTDTANYWSVYYYIYDMLKKEFDKNGIVIPFPQLDVHQS